jgi:hypothetical protein
MTRGTERNALDFRLIRSWYQPPALPATFDEAEPSGAGYWLRTGHDAIAQGALSRSLGCGHIIERCALSYRMSPINQLFTRAVSKEAISVVVGSGR